MCRCSPRPGSRRCARRPPAGRSPTGISARPQSSVATRVQFDHLAPVAVGSVVLAEATLVKVEGRRLIFTVSAARLDGRRVAASSVRAG